MFATRSIRHTIHVGVAGGIWRYEGIIGISPHRFITSDSSLRGSSSKGARIASKPLHELPPLSVMPTGILIRTLIMTYILSSPRIVALGIPIMNRISHSKSWFLDPDRNPVLHATVRKLVYDHFCAGESEKEVKNTIDTMKKMGFQGVILGYAKETVVDQETSRLENSQIVKAGTAGERTVEVWKQGTLRTLSMLGEDDFLAVKLTGAGPVATEAMAAGTHAPLIVWQAILAICDQAATQKTRLWVDAEQQVFQQAIDAWKTDLMRKYNRDGKAVVYNTFQAYLKATPENIRTHLKIAQEEGWTIGIKQVRGAYIASEPRHLIHDTIEDTHAAYNMIVQSLLTKSFPGLDPHRLFPDVQLMLASHNEESVKTGYETWRYRREKGLPTIRMEIAQLQGMADEVSCGLVQSRQQMTAGKTEGLENIWYPRAFKCLCWGGTRECVDFLVRRVTENRGSLERTRFWMVGLKRELWRRIKIPLGMR